MLTITCFSQTRQGWANFYGKFLSGPNRFLHVSTEISGKRDIFFESLLTAYLFCQKVHCLAVHYDRLAMSLQTKNTGKFFLDSLNLSFWKNKAEVSWKLEIVSISFDPLVSISPILLRRNKDLRSHLETKGAFDWEIRI